MGRRATLEYVSTDEETGGTGDGRNGTGGRGSRLVLVGGINSGWHCVQSGWGGAPVGRQKELTLKRTVADSSRERGEDHAAAPSPSSACQPGDRDTRR